VITTSFQDTGLAESIRPLVQRLSHEHVTLVAVGSGEALAMGRGGEADVIVAHSPEAEEAFMRDGFGTRRRPFMSNDFVVVGPPDDPARAAGGRDAAEAFARIAATKTTFVSRADQSGTHAKELSLWQRAKVAPQGSWYVASGAGQAEALRIAVERQAYALVDRSTFLSQRAGSSLRILVSGGDDLVNVYHVIEVRQRPGREAAAKSATSVSDALLGPEVQEVIATYGADRFGAPLFKPAAR
jgi:tungstate transport system substrate-binding protein